MKEPTKFVLVVEDDVDVCHSIEFTLQAAGFKVMAARSVGEANAKLKNQTFSCILVDINLGTERGDELISQIRSRRDLNNIATPILVISGHLDKAIVQALVGKVQGALVKPFDVAAVVDLVKRQAR